MDGFVREIFSSFQGEGAYAGRRQIFVRMAICNLNCCYCDTEKSRADLCKVEKKAGTGQFVLLKNPLDVKSVIDSIDKLITPDLHSVSFTGGEPLLNTDFIRSIAEETGVRKYLETSGISKKAFEEVIDPFDYAAIDIKLPSHHAVPAQRYEELYENEIGCISMSVERGIDTMAKVVILQDTEESDFRRICEDLPDNTGLVIQPVTPIRDIQPIPPSKIFKLSEIAGEFLHDIIVMPQVHRLIGVP